MSSADDLVLIFFIRDHPYIWDTNSTNKDARILQEQWNKIDTLINGSKGGDNIDELKSRWAKIVADFLDDASVYQQFLGFINHQPFVVVSRFDFDLSKYKNFDEAAFDVMDHHKAIEKIAKMERIYKYDTKQENQSDGRVQVNESRKDKERRSRFRTLDLPYKDDSNRFDIISERHRRDEGVKSRRPHLNRERELEKRGFSGGFGGSPFGPNRSPTFGARESDHYSDRGFGGFRSGGFGGDCTSRFGAFDGTFDGGFGGISTEGFGQSSRFNRNRFGESRDGFGACSRFNKTFAGNNRQYDRFLGSGKGLGAPHRDLNSETWKNSAKRPHGSSGRDTSDFSNKKEKPFSNQYGNRCDSEDYGTGFGGGFGSSRSYDGFGSGKFNRKCDGFGGDDQQPEKSNFGCCGSDWEERDLSDVEETFYLNKEDRNDSFCNDDKRMDIIAARQQLANDAKLKKEAEKLEKIAKNAEFEKKKDHANKMSKETDKKEELSIIDDPENYEDFYGKVAELRLDPLAEKRVKDKVASRKIEKSNVRFGENQEGRGPSRDYFTLNHGYSEESDSEDEELTIELVTNPERVKFIAETSFGNFEVESEELADAITWLNEPANKSTVKNAKKRIRVNRMNDIERLIQKKLVLQNEYLAFWSKRAAKMIVPESQAELNFLLKKGVSLAVQRETSVSKTMPSSSLDAKIARTPYGTVRTRSREDAKAITLLNNPANYMAILRCKENINSGKSLSAFEQGVQKLMELEEEFINQWKLRNIEEPLSEMDMSEMKWIISKEKKFDHAMQKKQAEELEAEEKKFMQAQSGHGFFVVRMNRGIGIDDPKIAFALSWIEENEVLCKLAKTRLALGSFGDLDLKVKGFLECQKKFVEDFKKGNLIRKNTDINLFVYCESVDEMLKNEKNPAEEYHHLQGAPADLIECNVALAVLSLQFENIHQYGNSWARVDGTDMLAHDPRTISDIKWLSQPEHATTIKEVKRKLAAALKLGEIDQAIVTKFGNEQNFIRRWRSEFKNRTDFELTVIVPEEFEFIQKKEAEYNAKKKDQGETFGKKMIATASSAAKSQDPIAQKEPVQGSSKCSAEEEQLKKTQEVSKKIRDIIACYKNKSESSVCSSEFAVMTQPDDSLMEAGVVEVAEELDDGGFVPTELSPSSSSFEMINESGNRTQQLTGMLSDLLIGFQHSSPSEFQTKDSPFR